MVDKSDNVLDELVRLKIEEFNAGYRFFKLDLKRSLKSENQKCFGLTDFDKGVISLDKNMNASLARETLLHEITHVVLELCGLGGDREDDNGAVREHNNEELTILISRSFLLLMNLNPELFGIILNGK